MNDQLQGKLVEILTSIQVATGKAADFTMAQLPDVAQSYVAYGRAWYTFVVIAAVLATWMFIRFAVKVDAKAKEYNKGVIWVPMGTLSLIAAIIGLVHAHSAFLVWFAPKVWLLQELANLVRNVK